jgi:hypothetical protein
VRIARLGMKPRIISLMSSGRTPAASLPFSMARYLLRWSRISAFMASLSLRSRRATFLPAWKCEETISGTSLAVSLVYHMPSG